MYKLSQRSEISSGRNIQKIGIGICCGETLRLCSGYSRVIEQSRNGLDRYTGLYYAVLHSPTYRDKYKEFLKIDFPRVPYPKTLANVRYKNTANTFTGKR